MLAGDDGVCCPIIANEAFKGSPLDPENLTARPRRELQRSLGGDVALSVQKD